MISSLRDVCSAGMMKAAPGGALIHRKAVLDDVHGTLHTPA